LYNFIKNTYVFILYPVLNILHIIIIQTIIKIIIENKLMSTLTSPVPKKENLNPEIK